MASLKAPFACGDILTLTLILLLLLYRLRDFGTGREHWQQRESPLMYEVNEETPA